MSNGEKLVTVVICTYNGSKKLQKVINAIENQNEFEEIVDKIIVVDNNSNDDTKEVIEDIINEKKFVEYRFEEKQGLSFARRHAIYSKTPWVAYIDDDNIMLQDWLSELKKVIYSSSDKLGIINGAVVPSPEVKYTQEESNILKAIYRDLACTHLKIEDIEKEENIKISPFGAGLCIKTEALKKIHNDGWLKLIGREGEKLSSGEDGELTLRILSLGYDYIFCNKMKMYHIIPPSRLEKKYVESLMLGLVTNYYSFISMKKFYIFQRVFRLLKYSLILLLSKKSVSKSEDPVKKIKTEIQEIVYKKFISMVLKDYIVLRRK